MSKTYELSYTAERIDEMLKEVDEHTIYSDATTEEHGLMSTTDKTKLDALPTAQQIEGSLSRKADKVSNATSGNFAGLDSNGNLTDSGKKASDFATAEALDSLVDYVDRVDHAKQNVLTFDSTPTPNSTNPVTSDGVFGALIGKQDVLDFDLTPTENSTKPVVSDGIYRALKRKEDTLTFDQTPTSRSVNPVTSNGIYDALSVKADKSDTYTKSEVDAKVVSVMRYKGSVNNYAALEAIQNPSVGDVYNVLDTGHNYAYDGTSWDVLSGIVSVDGKADKVDTPNVIHLDNGEHGFDTLTDAQVAGLRVGDIIEVSDVTGDEHGREIYLTYKRDDDDVINLMYIGNGQTNIIFYKLDKSNDYWDIVQVGEIQDKTPIMSILPSSGGILPNILYKLGTLANDANITIILETPTDNTIANVYTVTFDTGNFESSEINRGPSVSWGLPITTHWADGDAPSIEPNTCYEVSIMDDIAVCVTAEKVNNITPRP